MPNISEGRDHGWLQDLAAALQAIDGLALLHTTSDPSHHRSVFTMAGGAEPLRQAVTLLVDRAIAHIDLRRHDGAHPRIGAVDVIPFVPLGSTSMADAVALARDVGAQLAEGFDLPVYLYEDAALAPGRQRLERIRRGQFEGLAEKMRAPEWRPDFGPPHPHPSAGASVVGARPFLIAFNVNLASDRLDVAKRIAAVVRESSGGFRAVKAMGVWLQHRDLAQVSMNLTDFRQTPPQVVFDRIVQEAARDGVEVLESELIGLIPAAALAGTTPTHLRLADFSDDRRLEARLRAHGIAVV